MRPWSWSWSQKTPLHTLEIETKYYTHSDVTNPQKICNECIGKGLQTTYWPSHLPRSLCSSLASSALLNERMKWMNKRMVLFTSVHFRSWTLVLLLTLRSWTSILTVARVLFDTSICTAVQLLLCGFRMNSDSSIGGFRLLYLNGGTAIDQNDQKDANQSIGSTEPLIQSIDYKRYNAPLRRRRCKAAFHWPLATGDVIRGAVGGASWQTGWRPARRRCRSSWPAGGEWASRPRQWSPWTAWGPGTPPAAGQPLGSEVKVQHWN